MKYYIHCLKNYTNFSGRARRSEFWFFILFHFIFTIALLVLSNFLDAFILFDDDSNVLASLPVILCLIYFVATFIPTLAVVVRRLHDMGKSGTWFFVYFIPFIGGIWLLILLLSNSEPGMNKWGYNPKEQSHDEIDEIGSYLTS
jgi:uncharacterized membrane protein YhaH (DUF805 family)